MYATGNLKVSATDDLVVSGKPEGIRHQGYMVAEVFKPPMRLTPGFIRGNKEPTIPYYSSRFSGFPIMKPERINVMRITEDG
ncbi:MAG: hypothetical protein K8T10_21470 [Candidatus Eremiobacteraeota bacterium]|nr:hypothetical protein [Candidatus Eremiobacteraeota bacterium]